MDARRDALRQMASANDAGLSASNSSFVANVLAMLERTEYRRCDAGEDLENIYRLRYRAYRLSRMVPENAEHMVRDELDEAPNCFRFGVYVDGVLVSTLRLHHLTADAPWSPSFSVYPDVLKPMLDRGASFVDPSRFAVDPDLARSYPQLPYLTLRLAGMACFHFGAPYCLSTIKEEHAGFYRRIYLAERIGDVRPFPGLNDEVVLYVANVEAFGPRYLERFPFFRSTPREQRMLFSAPALGETAPLTVLPTAKYLQAAA